MATKWFDLHVEVGEHNNGEKYAKVILGGNGVVYERSSKWMADAICDVVAEMDKTGGLNAMAANPNLSNTVRSSKQVHQAVPVPSQPAPPTGPRVRAPDLGKIDSPGCQLRCIAYDNFGVAKCKSLCPSKKGI